MKYEGGGEKETAEEMFFLLEDTKDTLSEIDKQVRVYKDTLSEKKCP
jgi:hypothetical protein